MRSPSASPSHCCRRSSRTGCELTALRTIPTRVFGVLMSLEPAAAALAGLVVLGQHLTSRQLVALVLVSLASVGVTLGSRGDRPAPQPLE